MLYFDTSFLAPLILEERVSAAIERFMAGLPSSELAVSHWTRVEFASILAREVRMRAIAAAAAREVDAVFEAMVAESFVVWLPGAGDYDLAREYLARHETGLRAGDALHLAIAKNHGAEAIYSLDKKLLKAGVALGLPMRAGVRAGG